MSLIRATLAAASVFTVIGAADAATTFNFSSSNCQPVGACGVLDGPDGNIRTFSAGGIVLQASAWLTTAAALPNGAATRSSAWLGQYSDGLGVTNQSEGNGNNNNSHIVDNISQRDFVEFLFNQPVKILSVTLTPFVQNSGGNSYLDTDITYNFGTWNTAGVSNKSTTSNDPITYTITETPAAGTALFNLFASFQDDGQPDGFKITSIKVEQVPLPAALPMFLAALAGLGLISRRQS